MSQSEKMEDGTYWVKIELETLRDGYLDELASYASQLQTRVDQGTLRDVGFEPSQDCEYYAGGIVIYGWRPETKKERNQRLKQEARMEALRAKNKLTERERKLKQLAKLKKELGEP
jgi:hypothetical protein